MAKKKILAINDFRMRPGALLDQMGHLYAAAHEREMTVTQLLEDEDPSHDYPEGEDRKAGAFGRVIQASGFRFKSDPAEGIWADTYGTIINSPDGRNLIPAWAQSVARRTLAGGYFPQVKSQSRQILGSDESLLGSSFRPYVDAANVYNVDLALTLRLEDLVALTTPIQGDAYRRPYLVEPSESSMRLSRVGETAEIPKATISLAEEFTRIHKYGLGIELSYEAMRRSPIDKVGLFMAKVALRLEKDRVAQAIDVLINGDGNTNSSAENFDQSDLDTGTTPTVKGFYAFKEKWADPYSLNLIIGGEADIVALQMLQLPNDNPFFVQIGPALGMGGLTPLRDAAGNTVFFAKTTGIASGTYLGVDTRWALERVTEIGSDIEETQRYVSRQTEAIYFTSNDGFAVQDDDAAKTWSMA